MINERIYIFTANERYCQEQPANFVADNTSTRRFLGFYTL